MGEDQLLEILDGGCRELEARHALQLVECDSVSGPGVREPELGRLERAENAVEQLDNVACVDLSLVDRRERSDRVSVPRARARSSRRLPARARGPAKAYRS